jgi:hypothetical protein
VAAQYVPFRQGLAEGRAEEHVDPGVHLQPARVRAADEAGQRVERGRLSRQQRAARRQRRGVERVAAAPHLREQGIEARARGVVDRAVHGLG